MYIIYMYILLRVSSLFSKLSAVVAKFSVLIHAALVLLDFLKD